MLSRPRATLASVLSPLAFAAVLLASSQAEAASITLSGEGEISSISRSGFLMDRGITVGSLVSWELSYDPSAEVTHVLRANERTWEVTFSGAATLNELSIDDEILFNNLPMDARLADPASPILLPPSGFEILTFAISEPIDLGIDGVGLAITLVRQADEISMSLPGLAELITSFGLDSRLAMLAPADPDPCVPRHVRCDSPPTTALEAFMEARVVPEPSLLLLALLPLAGLVRRHVSL